MHFLNVGNFSKSGTRCGVLEDDFLLWSLRGSSLPLRRQVKQSSIYNKIIFVILDRFILRDDRNTEFYSIHPVIFYECISEARYGRSRPVREKSGVKHFEDFLFCFFEFMERKIARKKRS
jgi:hypothetical protein